MSTTAEPVRASIESVVKALFDIDGDTALDYLEALLDALKLVAKTESIDQRSKSDRETATYAELWLGNQLDAVQKIRKDKKQ